MSSPLRKRSRKGILKLKPWMDDICDQVEQPGFIQDDPVSFMHAFETKEDQEIAGFLAALMAWGRRDVVLRKTEDLLGRMSNSPHQFVLHYSWKEQRVFHSFRHRTFNHEDIHGLLSTLRNIYQSVSDFETFWQNCYHQAIEENRPLLALFRQHFLQQSDELSPRTLRHLSSPEKGSTCKRLSMFLRWCTRKNSPVDPGIWNFLDPSELLIPFDTHVARESRRLGLLTRRSNDWKAVSELTGQLSEMNPADPTRYDFALFGLGALDFDLPTGSSLNRMVD